MGPEQRTQKNEPSITSNNAAWLNGGLTPTKTPSRTNTTEMIVLYDTLLPVALGTVRDRRGTPSFWLGTPSSGRFIAILPMPAIELSLRHDLEVARHFSAVIDRRTGRFVQSF